MSGKYEVSKFYQFLEEEFRIQHDIHKDQVSLAELESLYKKLADFNESIVGNMEVFVENIINLLAATDFYLAEQGVKIVFLSKEDKKRLKNLLAEAYSEVDRIHEALVSALSMRHNDKLMKDVDRFKAYLYELSTCLDPFSFRVPLFGIKAQAKKEFGLDTDDLREKAKVWHKELDAAVNKHKALDRVKIAAHIMLTIMTWDKRQVKSSLEKVLRVSIARVNSLQQSGSVAYEAFQEVDGGSDNLLNKINVYAYYLARMAQAYLDGEEQVTLSQNLGPIKLSELLDMQDDKSMIAELDSLIRQYDPGGYSLFSGAAQSKEYCCVEEVVTPIGKKFN